MARLWIEALLEAALIGYQIEAGRLTKAIEDIRARLTGDHNTTPSAKPAQKQGLSAAARKRIAAAQKKRWARYRKERARS
jgi:hypothetical protein